METMEEATHLITEVMKGDTVTKVYGGGGIALPQQW